MIIFNKLDNYFVVSANSQTFLGFEMTANDNYFVVSANSQTFLGFEMTANFRDTSSLT